MKNQLDIDALIVDDHKMVRLGLANILEGMDCIRSVRQAENGRTALQFLAAQIFQFVFMDVKMPILDGIAATRAIAASYPHVYVIAMSAYDEEGYAKKMFASGAKGYLLKSTDRKEIENAISTILKGERYVSQSLSQAFVSRLLNVNNSDVVLPDYKLTEREQQVLLYLAQGYTSEDIAKLIFLSKKSVDLCRSQLLQKTKCKNSSELVRFALDHSFI